ncbi:MAG: GGDEF domain-containing protein [Rhodocyclaceae bacterium]|nr:GGDEF domain-containing protein [Rhodocyclaceae bacterium]
MLLVLTLAAAAVLVMFQVRNEQRRLAEALGREAAALSSRQVFEHLYGLMRKGWTRAEIDDALERLRRARPDMDIRLIRGAAVVRQYGVHAASSIPANDPLVAQALQSGEPEFAERDGRVRYVMPLRVVAECQACHQARIGEVNGAIDLSFQAERFRSPLQTAIRDTLEILAMVFLALFALMLALTRILVTRPLERLVADMESVVGDHDYARRIGIPQRGSSDLRRVVKAFDVLLADADRNQHLLLENSLRDPLTGAYNRRYLMQMLDGLSHQQANPLPYALYLVDLDRFKPINDAHGHAVGDRMLEAVVVALGQAIRSADVLARVGGDEFAVLAPELDREAAQALAVRLREAVEAIRLRWGTQLLQVGASVGLAWSGDSDDRRGEAMLDRADQAMYVQKRMRSALVTASEA